MHFDIDNVKVQISQLEQKTLEQDFWSNIENSNKVLQEIKSLQKKVDNFNKIYNDYEDIIVLLELSNESNDLTELNYIKTLYKEFVNKYDEFRITTLLNGPYDKNNAILTLHAGAGGTEACDWVQMLLRMYTRWAQSNNYSVETLDYLEGEEAGIKSVTIQINGENVFGYLKGEKGVHRLVRISPFDASGKRHTSFASCDVMPELDDDIEIDINPDDLRIDTYRSSGAGGQHVNKTESAIRITYLPYNIVVQCQNERSQHKNKDRAMKMLKAKILEKKQEEQDSFIKNIRGEVKEIGWGSQIRSYVFHPYNMVKDHRTNFEVGNIQSVMDGNINNFINAYLKWLIE